LGIIYKSIRNNSFCFAVGADAHGNEPQFRRHGWRNPVLRENRVLRIGFLLCIAALNGLLAFREGRKWKERGGAVEKLIPRARGRAYGCVWAAGLMTLYLVPGLWMVSRS
jgi:hypothetical protein